MWAPKGLPKEASDKLLAALRAAQGSGTKVAGALVVSLLAVAGANGVNLNPLVLS